MQDFTKNHRLVEILSVYNKSKSITPIETPYPDIDSVTPMKMLDLLFEAHHTPKEQQDIYTPLYQEILKGLEVDY